MRRIIADVAQKVADFAAGAVAVAFIVGLVVMVAIPLREGAPAFTAIFAFGVIVMTLSAGWFTATMIIAGLATYIASFLLISTVGPIAAQAICGIGLIICIFAWGRSMMPAQQRCFVAA